LRCELTQLAARRCGSRSDNVEARVGSTDCLRTGSAGADAETDHDRHSDHDDGGGGRQKWPWRPSGTSFRYRWTAQLAPFQHATPCVYNVSARRSESDVPALIRNATLRAGDRVGLEVVSDLCAARRILPRPSGGDTGPGRRCRRDRPCRLGRATPRDRGACRAHAEARQRADDDRSALPRP
jgi:hypothetical protein